MATKRITITMAEEAYKVLEAYDTESPKSKTNTALQLPLESINKILSKYEKDI